MDMLIFVVSAAAAVTCNYLSHRLHSMEHIDVFAAAQNHRDDARYK